MISNELRESAVELNAILANCSNEVLEKIPNKFKNRFIVIFFTP